MDAESRAYVSLMIDSLNHKEQILKAIYELCEQQNKLLGMPDMDVDNFEKTLKDKGSYLQEMTELDQGFDSIYRKIEPQILEHRDEYKSQILTMQEMIRNITDLSMKIQALEKKNADRFKIYVANEKSQIRKHKMSSNTATAYYNNMNSSGAQNPSYFFDKKK